MAESVEKPVALDEMIKRRERKLSESELHWQSEIQLRQRYVADLKEKIDASSSVEERKSLSASVQYNEECIDTCKVAMMNIETQRKLLIMGKESDVPSTHRPPSGVASKACPTKYESTSDDTEGLHHYKKLLDYHDSVQLRTAECVIVGGSGKILAMALNHTLPTTAASTPCGNVPVCTITQTRVGVKDGHLYVIDDNAYLITVIQTAKHLASPLPAHTPTPTPRSFTRRQDACSLSYMRRLRKKIVQCVLDSETSAYHLLHDQHWIKLTDGGGQPQFLEVLPMFVHHISLGIFTVRLNERLDHHPMIEYFDESGRKMRKSFRSFYSHEQIIRLWLRMLISQDHGARKMRFLFLGTHRDLEGQSAGESIQDKNAKLLKIVNSFKLKDNVVYSNQGCDNLIFAFNAKTPSPEVMRQVRNAMVKYSNVPPIQISIKWLVVELALRHFVKETQQPVLLESACLDMMAGFHIVQEDLKAALRHLHQARLIFYIEKKGLIVADTRVILDKLSELVHYSHHLRTSPSTQAALDGDWMKFHRYGILNGRCLEKFCRHYIEGVFTPEDLLDIFVRLQVVSELSPGEFLMPCLLPVEEPTFDTAPQVPVMAVEFPNGGPMLGTFCDLVCHLTSTKKWELATVQNGEPCCLTRSSVDFSAPESLPGRVTISDSLSSFFLVAYHGPLDVAKRVCPIIRETVVKGMKRIFETPNCSSQSGEGGAASLYCRLLDVGHTTITFLCSCQITPPHAAVLSKNGKYLKCPHNTQRFERVTAKHKMWLVDDTKMTKSPQRTTSSTTFIALTLRSLVLLKWCDEQGQSHTFRLTDRVSSDWVLFGTLLGFAPNQLDVLRQNHSGNSAHCWRAVMELWMRGGRGGQDQLYPVTWEGLYQLLEDAEYSEVASELERAVCSASSAGRHSASVGICSDCEGHTSSPRFRHKSSCPFQ